MTLSDTQSARPLRGLWVCGAVASGKSTAAWGLFESLAATGAPVAYVDIDQLGMLYPDEDDDPEGHALKCAALDALVPGYAAAGAGTLVVSGVVDVRRGPTLASDVDLTLCLLSPDPAELRDRILARGWDEADAQEAVAEDRLLRAADFVDVLVESAGLSVVDTVAELRRVTGAPGSGGERAALPASDAALDVVVVTGPRAVGSSTVSFGVARGRWQAGRKTGFLALQQLGFLARDGLPATDVVLATAQLAAMHRLMAARGAGLLVVSGHLRPHDRALLVRALPEARVSVVRLRADEATLRAHVRARARGSQARLAGDDLLSADRQRQDLVVATALAEQATLDASSDEDALIDVSGRAVDDAVAEVAKLVRP